MTTFPLASRFDSGIALTTNGDGRLKWPRAHEFLLDLHRSAGFIQPRTVRVRLSVVRMAKARGYGDAIAEVTYPYAIRATTSVDTIPYRGHAMLVTWHTLTYGQSEKEKSRDCGSAIPQRFRKVGYSRWDEQ